jgi:hypothetical protein
VNVHGRLAVRLQIAATGVLVLAVVLLVFGAVGSRGSSLAAASAAPDSTTVDRLTGRYFDRMGSTALALAPTAGQKAAMLAAGLLLGPTLFPVSLPLVSK